MPTLDLTDQQVADLVRQLPPNQRREILLSLARDAATRRDGRMQQAEAQLRKLAERRGLNWEQMSDQQRESLIDDLVHEDRGCT